MKVVGITGGIASGKSTISSYLQNKHKAYIFDADKEAKLLLNSKLISEKIYKAFPKLLDLSKASIANEAFKNQESQRKINNIIHPVISDLILERINDKKTSHTLFVIDAALIIESGIFNKHRENGSQLILVTAEKDLRLQRALERSNLSEQTINNRMKLQMNDSQKIKYADYIIKNNSTKSELYNRVDEIIKKIIHE
jgi:dephospho-CoA kinase